MAVPVFTRPDLRERPWALTKHSKKTQTKTGGRHHGKLSAAPDTFEPSRSDPSNHAGPTMDPLDPTSGTGQAHVYFGHTSIAPKPYPWENIRYACFDKIMLRCDISALLEVQLESCYFYNARLI